MKTSTKIVVCVVACLLTTPIGGLLAFLACQYIESRMAKKNEGIDG